MNLLIILKNKKLPIIFLLVALVLSTFVLYTPKPVSKDDTNSFSAVRAQEHIEAISRKPHSYYDRQEHEEVRQYLIDTLSNYLGSPNVNEYNYSVTDVKNRLTIINNEAGKTRFNLDKVVYPVENVLGVLNGENTEGILLVSHYDSRGHIGRSGEMGRSYGAMDDGYGVSTMLEFAYLFKDINPKNSIYFLFTDAEEVDLYGSIMAANEPDFMNKIKFVINLESRGRYGPSYMFETSNNNHKVIDLYKKSSLPVTYSMATAVYSVMPNFTDFTPFIEKNIPGMNYATLAGLDNYHSPLDSYENINISSIQHMGTQVEPVLREFISNDKYVEANYFDANSNQVFFTIFAGVLVSYSKIMAIILVVLLVVLLFLVTILKLKDKEFTKDIAKKTLPKSLLVFLSMIVIGLLYSMLVAFIGKTAFSVTYTRVSNTELPTLLLMILLTLGLFKLINKNENNVLYLGVVVNVLLTIITTFTLEGASFLFAFTSLFGLIVLLTDKLTNKIVKNIIIGVSYTFMILLLIPLLYSFFMALTVGGVVVLLVLLAINGSVTVPMIIKQFN